MGLTVTPGPAFSAAIEKITALNFPQDQLATGGISWHVTGDGGHDIIYPPGTGVWPTRWNLFCKDTDATGYEYTISVDGTEVVNWTATSTSAGTIALNLKNEFNSSSDPAKSGLEAVSAGDECVITTEHNTTTPPTPATGFVVTVTTTAPAGSIVATEHNYGLPHLSVYYLLGGSTASNPSRHLARIELEDDGDDVYTWVDPLTTSVKQDIIRGIRDPFFHIFTLSNWTNPENYVTRVSDKIVEVEIALTTRRSASSTAALGTTNYRLDKDTYLVNGVPATANVDLPGTTPTELGMVAFNTARDAMVYGTQQYVFGNQTTSITPGLITGGSYPNYDRTPVAAPYVVIRWDGWSDDASSLAYWLLGGQNAIVDVSELRSTSTPYWKALTVGSLTIFGQGSSSDLYISGIGPSDIDTVNDSFGMRMPFATYHLRDS